VPGETVREFMAEHGISGKELAAAGGFSLSRVAELRQVGDMPARWNGRDRHATTWQWADAQKAAAAYAAKRDRARTPNSDP
jgi:transcriptional regulator with XRE-family HTH domain